MAAWYNDSAQSNTPDSSYPDPSGNAWAVVPPGNFGGCVKTIAMCGR